MHCGPSSTRVWLQVLVVCCDFMRVRLYSDICGGGGLESCTGRRMLGKCLSKPFVLGAYMIYSHS